MSLEASSTPDAEIISHNETVPLESSVFETTLDEVFPLSSEENRPADLDISWVDTSSDFNNFFYSSSLLVHNIVLDDCLVISGDEYQALSHYQHGFISDRLLKTPRWSTFGCILQSVSHIPMTMHFLIAISSMDLNQRSPHQAISLDVSRAHLRRGTEMLIRLMNIDTEPHHFSTLSSWFFLYLCMANRDVLDKEAVNRLSIGILNYVRRYRLDSLSAGIRSEEISLAPSHQDPILSTESGLIGRVLLFMAAVDVGMGFQGCGGHLAKHLYLNLDKYWRIFSLQRYILERYWGPSYPEYEVVHDLETTTAMEMVYKVGRLFHRVNELSEKSHQEAAAGDLDLGRRIAEIETVFYPSTFFISPHLLNILSTFDPLFPN